LVGGNENPTPMEAKQRGAGFQTCCIAGFQPAALPATEGVEVQFDLSTASDRTPQSLRRLRFTVLNVGIHPSP
jgi:hypothetical protein